ATASALTVRKTTGYRRSSALVPASVTAPPPSETTPPSARAAATAARSYSRKRASPSSAKIRGIGPCSATTRRSVSVNGTCSRRATLRPTLVLPAAIGPTSATLSGRSVGSGEVLMGEQRRLGCRSGAQRLRNGLEVAAQVAPRLADAVAAELLENGVRQLDRHHRLGDHAGGRNRADVRALVVRRRLLAGGDVDGAQRVRHGRDRLHAGADAQHGAGGHAALRAAGAVGAAGDAVVGLEQLVMRGGAAAAGGLEAVADLDPLDGLDAHQRLCEAPV